MLPSRKATASFIGVFVIGAVVGALVMWDLTDTELIKFMNKTNDPDSVIAARVKQKYIEQFHLTPEELDRTWPIMQEMSQHVSQERRQFAVRILAVLDDYHSKIAQQLAPEHRAAYQQYMDNRRKQISAMLLMDENPAGSVSK
jgi:hypothetical protein